MMRRIAVVGDELTSGGHVVDSGHVATLSFMGYKGAQIGGLAHCDACGSDGTIAKAGGPRRMGIMGRENALDGDIVLCQCSEHPRIVASLAGNTTFEDESFGGQVFQYSPSQVSGSSQTVAASEEIEAECFA